MGVDRPVPVLPCAGNGDDARRPIRTERHGDQRIRPAAHQRFANEPARSGCGRSRGPVDDRFLDGIHQARSVRGRFREGCGIVAGDGMADAPEHVAELARIRRERRIRRRSRFTRRRVRGRK